MFFARITAIYPLLYGSKPGFDMQPLAAGPGGTWVNNGSPFLQQLWQANQLQIPNVSVGQIVPVFETTSHSPNGADYRFKDACCYPGLPIPFPTCCPSGNVPASVTLTFVSSWALLNGKSITYNFNPTPGHSVYIPATIAGYIGGDPNMPYAQIPGSTCNLYVVWNCTSPTGGENIGISNWTITLYVGDADPTTGVPLGINIPLYPTDADPNQSPPVSPTYDNTICSPFKYILKTTTGFPPFATFADYTVNGTFYTIACSSIPASFTWNGAVS
jgi:hypothetical protein